jgi:hypothetical protein
MKSSRHSFISKVTIFASVASSNCVKPIPHRTRTQYLQCRKRVGVDVASGEENSRTWNGSFLSKFESQSIKRYCIVRGELSSKSSLILSEINHSKIIYIYLNGISNTSPRRLFDSTDKRQYMSEIIGIDVNTAIGSAIVDHL